MKTEKIAHLLCTLPEYGNRRAILHGYRRVGSGYYQLLADVEVIDLEGWGNRIRRWEEPASNIIVGGGKLVREEPVNCPRCGFPDGMKCGRTFGCPGY